MDLASATSLLLGGTARSAVMGVDVPSVELALGLYALGAAAIATSLFSAMIVGMRHPRAFSALMAAYGLSMLVIGLTMYTAMSDVSLLYAYGMVVVGLLMVANSLLAFRDRVEM